VFSSERLKLRGLEKALLLPWAQEAEGTEYQRWSLQFSGKQVMRAVSDMPQSEKETQCARVVSELATIRPKSCPRLAGGRVCCWILQVSGAAWAAVNLGRRSALG
jgi:hypothetical protein